MTYEIEVGGRVRQVAVGRAGGGFIVTVDGRSWQVDAARVGAATWSLLISGDEARSLEIAVAPGVEPGQLTVTVDSAPVPVAVNGRRRWGRKDDGGAAGTGPQRIIAPMPGKIARVLVKTGEAIRARQPLVVVEAMKMENELRAGRDGTVAEVHAREGQSVDAGALLVVIQ